MNIKRTIFLFIICAVCAAATPAQEASQPNSLNLESLVGRVKRIDEETAELRMQNGALKEGSRAPSRSVAFDKKGRMIYRWWKIGELPPNEKSFSYEKNNRRIERGASSNSFTHVEPFLFESVGLSVFRYVASENVLYRDVYPSDMVRINEPPRFKEQTQKYKYIFDADQRLLETIDYAMNTGDELVFNKNIYGTERLPIQSVISVKGSSLKETVKYTYTLDEQGNWTKRVSEDTLADKNGTVVRRVEYRKIIYYK